MKKWVVIAVLLFFVSLPALVDVMSEVVDAAGTDITDRFKSENSLVYALYTHFFSPLTEKMESSGFGLYASFSF